MKLRMLSAVVLLLAIALNATGSAKPAHKKPAAMYRVVQADPGSITVTLGHSGEVHESYKIGVHTKITIDGAPATAQDLKAGMMVHVEVGPDKTTATSIAAHSPPANLRGHRAG
jgi:hypothetical protein